VSGSAWRPCGITSRTASHCADANAGAAWYLQATWRHRLRGALVLKRDINTLASFAVFQRVQASGERLTLQLAREVLAESGSDANAKAAYYQAREWLRDCDSTKRLGRR
jgi:hypothetical protein